MPTNFYSSYGDYKKYRSPSIEPKDIQRYDAEIWEPAGFSKSMEYLEIGSGTGEFLTYLYQKGVVNFYGIDIDPNLKEVQKHEIAEKFECISAWEYLNSCEKNRFDRVILLDVLEHFSPEEAIELLYLIKKILREKGFIVLKVPNAASPWGLNYQVGDLTHKTSYSSDSLRQLAIACDLNVISIYDQNRGSKRRLITNKIINKFLSWALLTPPKFWGANLYCILSAK